MKNILFPLLMLVSAFSFAQNPEVTKHGGYTLTFTNTDPNLDPAVKQKLISTFFEVYPKLAKTYNKNTAKEVYMLIDTAYKGVAETDNAHVRISSKWFHLHPNDIDVVTHEVMHIVQDYKESSGPGWLTEGIADYARYKFGIDNAGAKWALPEFKAGQSYTNSYRITARFLAWLEIHTQKDIVKKLDKQLREHTYTDRSWSSIAGKPLDELWKEYAQNPAL